MMALVTSLSAGGRDVCYKCRGLLQVGACYNALVVLGCMSLWGVPLFLDIFSICTDRQSVTSHPLPTHPHPHKR